MKQFGIVLLVSERSGSNLLRSLLGNHSTIVAPVAPHFLAEFYPFKHYYKDLTQISNIRKLFDDMVALANHPYHNWNLQIEWNEQEIQTHNINSVIKMMDYIYKKKAVIEGKTNYCSKGIHSFQFIDQIRAEQPTMKFIHLVRDPRDHVASWLRRPIHLFTAYDAVLKWQEEQKVFIDAVRFKGLDCISICYEDLIQNPESTVGNVLQFLELPIEDACFQTDSGKNKEAEWNPYWQNLKKPIIKNNKQKYKTELNKEDILIIETISQIEMKFFNYSFETDCDWRPDESFHLTLERQRNGRKNNDDEFLKKSMPKLQSKQELVQSIRKKRFNEWHKNAPTKQFIIKPKRKNVDNSRLKKNLLYFAYALFGESITNSLKSKVKKNKIFKWS